MEYFLASPEILKYDGIVECSTSALGYKKTEMNDDLHYIVRFDDWNRFVEWHDQLQLDTPEKYHGWCRGFFLDNYAIDVSEMTIESMKEHGFMSEIEYRTGLTTERNVAYALGAFCFHEGINPIELFEKIK